MAVQPGMATTALRDQIYSLVASELGPLSQDLNPEASFAELGFDSLGLMRLTELIEQRYGLVVSFRSLMGELSTAQRLAEHVVAHALSRPEFPSVTSHIADEHPAAFRPAVARPLTWSARQAKYVEQFLSWLLARTNGSQTIGEQGERVSGTRAVVFPGIELPPLRCPIVFPVDSCRLRDVDGNEYVDLSMGSGVFLFGHGVSFASDALMQQISKGYALGPQPELVGEVAERICELTSLERVTFCNSGTEAIFAALRIARAVTRRNRIVVFRGAEHGNFDGTQPGSPGVVPAIAADVLMLEYGAEASLDAIRRESSTLAAILVEPVQGRQPHIQPREFLQSLRQITERYGIALIFDEVTTGFRCHPGGAQALFGVRADLVTYGKALGGGMPIGVVAGAARFMDAIDGGNWSFDDGSEPYATQTFFAGTFCKHPLTVATTAAFLDHLCREGPAALTALNDRTDRLAARMNEVLERSGAPIRVRHFSSWFVFDGDPTLLDLFRHHLLLEGLFVWGDGPCFLSTAHGDREIDAVIEAVEKSAAALRGAAFFDDANVQNVSAGQQEIWTISQFGSEASAAFNEPATLRLRGPLDVEALQRAIQALVDRHNALRTTFSADGESQVIHETMMIPLPIHTLDEGEAAGLRAIQQRIAQPFDLEMGPLVRTELFHRSTEDHILLLVLHHLIMDGSSMGVLLEELAQAYAATVRGARWEPGAPASKLRGEPDARDEEYWATQLADPPPPLALPADFVRPQVRTFRGDRLQHRVRSTSAIDLRTLAGEGNVTTFIALLSAYSVLLHHLCRQPDLIVGCAAGMASGRAADVGFFVALLPIRSRIRPDLTFASHMQAMRELVVNMQEHPRVSLASLARRLGLKPNPGYHALISTTFAVERPSVPLLLPGLTVTADAPESGFSKYDLTLNIDDLSLTCDWTFNTNMFRRATVEQWAAQFDSLLGRVTADASTRMDELADVLNRAAQEAADARARDEWNELRKLKRR